MKVIYNPDKHFTPRTGSFEVYGVLLQPGENDVPDEVAKFLADAGLLDDPPKTTTAKKEAAT